jgi:aminomethyltransferase
VSDSTSRLSPLDAVHEAAGASFTDFGGWRMPVRYGSDLAEHETVRTAAGLFDLSHMAEFLVSGPQAAEFLDAALAGRASAITNGRAKYSLLLTDDGAILDDLVVYRLADDEFWVVANAGNHDIVAAELTARSDGFEVTVGDETDTCALVAVQGPGSLEVLAKLEGLDAHLDAIRYYGIVETTYRGQPILVARTGYTGEDGFELYLDNPGAADLWNDLVSAGATPCGLAARDTLRLEAGMPLYGHELTRDIRPREAGLGRVADIGTPGARVLVGLASEGKRAGRAGYPVLRGDEIVGEVTSGALSPTLGHPIAMAYVDADVSAVGTELALDVRGTAIPATVVSLPFYSRKKAGS